MKTKQFIFLGPTGARAQEHAAALAKQWHIPYVSTPELLQQAIAKQTALGVEASPYIEAGELVPDTIVLKLMRQRFEQPDTVLKGWILDGFPCTVAQAQGFDEWWAIMGSSTPTVVYFKVMAGILINRLYTELGETESLSAIRRRLDQYQAEIDPILEYYQQRDQLKTINASLSFAEVARDLACLGQENIGSAPLIQNEAELDTLIASQSRLVVDCMASWCGSCKQVTPSIDKLAEEYGDRVKVMKIDFDANRQLSKRFGLQGIPAVMFFKDGELLKTLTGVKSYHEYNAAVMTLLN
ncbi:MAG: nucleoside monophosphate kinase [Elainellaceae cyanobacterium]